jgi:hypothetical protein
LCGNDREGWPLGCSAYDAVATLSVGERKLIRTLHHSQCLLSGLKWIEWVFADCSTFADPRAVVRRMEHILKGLRQTDLSLPAAWDDRH